MKNYSIRDSHETSARVRPEKPLENAAIPPVPANQEVTPLLATSRLEKNQRSR
jgi:hypothetical protein